MHGTAGFLTHEACLVIEPGGGLKGSARHNRADGAWRFSKGRCSQLPQFQLEYWKGGRDRVRRGFNPDFFIKIDLDKYITILKKKGGVKNIDALRELQDKGYETLVRAVEIKSDDDDDEATPAKAEWAKAHFEAVNAKLLEPLPGNFDKEYKPDTKQFYTFDLLKPEGYVKWFENLHAGKINY